MISLMLVHWLTPQSRSRVRASGPKAPKSVPLILTAILLGLRLIEPPAASGAIINVDRIVTAQSNSAIFVGSITAAADNDMAGSTDLGPQSGSFETGPVTFSAASASGKLMFSSTVTVSGDALHIVGQITASGEAKGDPNSAQLLASSRALFNDHLTFTLTDRTYRLTGTGMASSSSSGMGAVLTAVAHAGVNASDLSTPAAFRLLATENTSDTESVSDALLSPGREYFFDARTDIRLSKQLEGVLSANTSISYSIDLVAVSDIIRWINPAGGTFSTTANWNPQRVPEKTDTRTDIALFDLDQNYTVSVDGSRTVERLVVRDGRVQFTGDALTVAATSPTDPSVSVEGDGRLNVVDGELRSVHAIIGNAPPPDPQNPLIAEVLVSNDATDWIASGNIAVGGAGKGRLFVAGGAKVTSAAATIGGPFRGEATVGGEDSLWTTGNLAVGAGDNPNTPNIEASGPGTLNIEAGGLVDSDEAVIGQGTGLGSRVTVTGRDSQDASSWHVSKALKVGAAGSGRLEVTSGGNAIAIGDIEIATEAAGTGAVVVSGAGGSIPLASQRSALGSVSNLRVGRGGVGELTVEGGAFFFAEDVVIGEISQGTVTVRGTLPGAAVRTSLRCNLLAVGELDHGRLVIEGGAEVISEQGQVGSVAAPPGDTTSGEVFIRGARVGTTPASVWAVMQNLDVGIDTESAGRMTMEGGRLDVGGTLTVGPRGTLLGIGTVSAGNRVRNGGIVAVGLSPGKLTITGDYEQTAAGRLDVEIGGLTPEVQHDQLEVSGNVTMAGVLNLIFRDRFAPRMGDQFTLLMVGGALSTDALDVNIVNLAPGFEYDLMLAGGAMTLVAKNDATFVPEPSTLTLLALALLMGRIRRRAGDTRLPSAATCVAEPREANSYATLLQEP